MENTASTAQTKTVTKSIFALDSDSDECPNDVDSGIAYSFESSPTHDLNETVQSAIEVLNNDTQDSRNSEETSENDSSALDSVNGSETKLSAFQKARIERNRQRALLLRQARLQAHPYKNANQEEHSVIRIQNSRLIDTGGGFLIDEKDLEEEQSKEVVISEDPAPIILPERPHCDECQQPIHDSFLYRSFAYPVCDTCRDDDDKHALITRTDARQEYLLKDCDLDLREPILRFILRKNPHNPRWGDMKLYLRTQVESRALEIWESLEKIEEEKELRNAKREKTKTKKFNQQIKSLRMAVRSSVYTKQITSHEHVFGPEQFDAEKDLYYRKCATCSYLQEYEKM